MNRIKLAFIYNEVDHPMPGSSRVRDPEFENRVAAEIRSLLATVRA